MLIQSRPVPHLSFLVSAILTFAVGGFALLTPLRRLADGGLVIGIFCLIGGVIQAFLWIWLMVRARRHAWVVRIGPDGVTWSDGPVHLSWSDVAELRVVRRRRNPWSSQVPGVHLVDRAEADFAARASSRAVGYAIDTSQLRATPEGVLAAISRFSAAPVVHE